MALRWKTLWGALATLVLTAAPAEAQAQVQQGPPVPRVYGRTDGPEPAPREKSPGRTAREATAADAAEAECNAGDQRGCAGLGRAFLFGEGRPQSRPVAEILLREACTASEGSACFALGDFFANSRNDDLHREGGALLRRGCDLGLLDACASLAEVIETGLTPEDTPDPVAAEKLRREACARAGAAACTALAARQLADPAPEAQAPALARLAQLCGGGYANACDRLIAHLTPRLAERTDIPAPMLRRALDDGCRVGLADACDDLGRAIFAETAGPPETRAEALTLFDRACDLDSSECRAPMAIRAYPALAAGCAARDQDACAALGDLLTDFFSPLYDPARAARLFGGACEAGRTASCERAATILMQRPRAMTQGDKADVASWLGKGCEAGEAGPCETLGRQLLGSDLLPPDRARGLTLLALACDDARAEACDTLARESWQDPEAPLPAADPRVLPPMTEDEQAAFDRQRGEERRAKMLRDLETDCTTTVVVFRGVTYTDTICTSQSRVIGGGFDAKIGEAPWQALIWRPAVLGSYRLTLPERVECGGAVIRSGWILTAAHCLVDHIDKVGNFPIEKSGYRIRLGVSNPLDNEGISYPILRTIAHPAFSRNGYAFDIGLIQYDPARGERAPVVQPIARIRLDDKPLAQRTITPLMPAYTFGWGWTAYEGPSKPPDVLRGAKLELRDTAACAKVTKLQGDRSLSVLCAVGARGEQACFGDSGGPLITYGDPGKMPTVIGVVSAGIKCGTTGVPSRFTRLGHPAVQAWLNSHVPGFRSGQTAR